MKSLLEETVIVFQVNFKGLYTSIANNVVKAKIGAFCFSMFDQYVKLTLFSMIRNFYSTF